MASTTPNPAGGRPWRRPLTLADLELGLGVLLTLLLVVLHVRYFLHAGGLWRDETQIVNIANAPTLSAWWERSEHDTFPVVWQLLLRGWAILGLGQTDPGLRVLGLGIGLGVLAALWWGARRLGPRVPLLALALFGLNPTLIRYGDSVRGYGAGTLAMLLMFGAVWAVVRAPTRRHVWVGLGLCLLGVQSMHFNSIVLLTLGGAAVAVALLRRSRAAAVAVLGIGVACAVSVLPYADPILRQRPWKDMVHAPHANLRWFFARFAEAANDSGGGMVWVWVALWVLALGACGHRLLARSTAPEHAPRREQALFLLTTLLLGVAAYAVFLLSSRLPTHRWYYIAIMGLLAVAFDASFALLAGPGRAGRLARLALVALLIAGTAPNAWTATRVRMTNVDLLAAHLESQAAPGDLIVLTPWWYGVSFQRYYHGRATFTTMPSIEDLTMQRFDLLRQRLTSPEPTAPVLAAVERTLRAGHRLWVVGELPLTPSNAPLGELAPYPTGSSDVSTYVGMWARVLVYVLQGHGAEIEGRSLTFRSLTSEYERPRLFKIQGWRDP